MQDSSDTFGCELYPHIFPRHCLYIFRSSLVNRVSSLVHVYLPTAPHSNPDDNSPRVGGKRAGMEYYCARVACSPACVAIGYDLSIRGTGGPPVRWFVIKSRNSVEPCSAKGVEPPCETHKPRCAQSSEFIRAYQQQTD